ncbi:transposable element Tcb1 transposase [Trichonephila clavipes]|nr:transposable element Tcb1 transposase [Trichonephila clavipes]
MILRGRIIGQLECGLTQLQVSEELGITQCHLQSLAQRIQDDGNVSRCYSTGSPRGTQQRMRTGRRQFLPKKQTNTASDRSRQLSSGTGTTVSRQTVYRRLGHIDLYTRRPVRCVSAFTSTHCRPAVNLE